MAPSESRPPLNFADGGAVNWASDSSIYNTQSQLGNIAATPGGFGGMAKQFTSEGPFGMNPMSQPQMAPMTSGNLPMQPKPIMPPMTPLAKMPPASMAKGGRVENLMTQLRQEFKKRGLDFDKVMAKRLAEKGQSGDTILAHINPEEAAMLKKAGGSGSINPHTGLPSFRVDDDGPERGSTGSASSTGYSGRPSGGSAEGFAARAGDTPGFGTGGGGSVGGGGGYGVTGRGDIAGGGDRGGNIDFSGGGESQSERMQRLVQEDLQRYYAKQNEEAAKANAARIAAEREAYQQPPQQSILSQIGNVIGQTIGVTPAEAGTRPTIRNIRQELPLGPSDEEMAKINEQINAAKRAGTYISATGGFGAKPLPSSLQNRGPNVGYEAPIEGEFETQPVTTKSPFKTVVDAITSETTPSAPTASEYGYTPPPIQDVPVQTVPYGPTANIYNYTPPVSELPVTDKQKLALLDEARKSSMSSQFTQPSPTENVYTYTPPVTESVISTSTSNAPAAPVGVLSKVPAKPVTAGQAAVAAPIYSADPNIAALEKAGKFAGGSRADVAAALGVDPSQLKERIVFYDGTPRVDYYTKDWGQALGEAFSGLPNLISGLTTPSVYSTPRGSFVRDPQFSDLFTQTEERRDYGPYGDMTLEEYRKLYGGKEDLPPIVKPKTEVETKTETAPETKTPVGNPATAEWSRTRTGLPSDPYNYGYGGEYTYFSAKGGHVGPLSKIRK